MKKPISSKGFTLIETLIVLIILVLLTAMAVPAFQKIRASSQDKAVTNNLRQIYEGANRYFVEHGVSSVATSVLVGTDSTSYLQPIQTVAGESYSNVVVRGSPITATGVAGVRTVTYQE